MAVRMRVTSLMLGSLPRGNRLVSPGGQTKRSGHRRRKSASLEGTRAAALRASVVSPEVTKSVSPAHEVGGQPLVTKGVQPPPPEPDRHLLAHPALQCQVLWMKAESLIRATSTLVEPSTCPPSSCPGRYPRHLA